MRKSGNHTSHKQWVYVLWNLPWVHTCKVGIGGNLRQRVRQVDKGNKGWDILVFAVRIWFAYDVEQWIGATCKGFKATGFKGTGKTERYKIIVLPFAITVLTITWLLQQAIFLAVACFIVWLLAGQPYLTLCIF